MGMHPPLPLFLHPTTSPLLTQTLQLQTITKLMHQLPCHNVLIESWLSEMACATAACGERCKWIQLTQKQMLATWNSCQSSSDPDWDYLCTVSISHSLADCIRVVATGVYKTSVIASQSQFTMHLGFLPHLRPPLGIKGRCKFSFILMANVWVRSRGWRSGSTYGKGIEDGHPQGSKQLFCFLEDQRHQDNYLTSRITSSSPWGHYSFANGRHFHGELP